MRQTPDNPREYRIGMFHLFTEFHPAYNTVNRNELFEALKEFQITQRLIRVVKLSVKYERYRFKIQSNLSE
jgi:hypothetical protein